MTDFVPITCQSCGSSDLEKVNETTYRCNSCGTTFTHETPAAPRRGAPLWAQIVIWIGLLALLVVVAIGLKKAQEGSVQTGDRISAFKLKFFDQYTYGDKSEVALADLKGKVVVINFWASWCIPCEQEAAALESAWKSYEPGGKVVFLGVDYVDTEPQALEYLKKFSITYPNGPDLQTRISQMFRISGVPETYVLGPDGKLVASQIGPFTSEEDLHKMIDPLIK